MLAVFAFHAILIGIVLLPAAGITAVLAFAIRTSRVAVAARGTVLVSVGTIVPALLAAYGFYQAWPWPWIQPDVLYDGLGQKGSLLIVATGPSWFACLTISWLVLRSRTGAR
jgi:hypothetical protein